MRRISNILAYFEDAPLPDEVEACIRVAKEAGSKLTMASVIRPAKSQVRFIRADFDFKKVEELLVQERHSQLEDSIRQVAPDEIEISTDVYVGETVETIIKAVKEKPYDLLIKILRHSEGSMKPEFGSLDMRLMRSCPCTVAMARNVGETGTNRAVAALDFDEGDSILEDLNQEILESMSLLSHKDYMAMKEIHVIHVWSVYGEQLFKRGPAKLPEDQFHEIIQEEESNRRQWLQERIDRYCSTLDKTAAEHFNPELVLLQGDPNTAIAQYTNEINADTLCMGTVSRSGLSRFLMGNTAESVLNSVHCSVVTHKPRGFSVS
jgi:nucleotide-binding universal stress UspA family protein